MKQSKEKKHADFQDAYRRSSDFRSVIKKETFKVTKDGAVTLEKER